MNESTALNKINLGDFAAELTDADLEKARTEMPYLPKNRVMAEIAIRVYAMRYVLQRKGPTLPQVADALDAKITQQRLAAKALVGVGRYANIALADPLNLPSQTLDFLRANCPNAARPHLLLLGGAGTGKTFTAIAYIASLMTSYLTPRGKEWDGMIITSRGLMDLLGAGADKTEVINKLKHTRYLIIDDLKFGKKTDDGVVTEPFISLVEDIFEHREMRAKTTVITSNGTPEQIKKTYGDRFSSRFAGSGLVHQSTGTDLRRAQ